MVAICAKSTRSVMILVLVGGALFTVVSANVGDGGSKCADTSCTPAPPGVQCEPRYGERDECCPVWHCANGQTIYGMTKGSTSSTSFSSFSSSSSSGGNPFGGTNPFAGMFGGGNAGGGIGGIFGQNGGGLFGLLGRR